MANFNGYVLTEAGRELLAKGLSGEKIEFTKMQIGDGVSSTDARSMSSLVNPKKDLNIISIRAEGGQCKLGALLSNKDLQTGFYVKELGVFARGNDNIEKLYAYNTSPNPDFIPPFSSNNIVEIEYVDTLIVDRATNITALIDPSITYITKETADQTYLNINEKMKWMGTDGYGGLLQDVGTKRIGIAYYDKANKQMVVPTVENTLTYFEGAKFIPISDYQTAKKLENLFTFGNDWVKFSSGLIIQWGEVAVQNGKGYVNLPIRFKNRNYQIITSDTGGGAHRTGAAPVDEGRFEAFGRDGSGELRSTGIRWIAIGF